MAIIAPSVLSANFLRLEEDIKMINQSEAHWFHVDVMDGVFVPNISFGFPVIEALAAAATKPLDIHLMIVDPGKYIKEFAKYKPKVISVHYEACTHLHRVLGQIKDEGIMAGVVLNPATPVSALEDIINDIDLVLLMSVNPGFGGQKFIENTYQKIQKTKTLISSVGKEILIEIDGGVNLQNAKTLIEHGADVLVAGNTVFNSPSPSTTIADLAKI